MNSKCPVDVRNDAKSGEMQDPLLPKPKSPSSGSLEVSGEQLDQLLNLMGQLLIATQMVIEQNHQFLQLVGQIANDDGIGQQTHYLNGKPI